ncbi:hypothetical protein Ga0123462_1058 [Mariprofundus ferrinatatus]|uniref:Uncharacterized protein n=1 Tax=Mariprofundus ferrinatatus TaxID=1921087 RepID=A0A2K8L3L8_9PROT|nr:hypothetical protein [Mariprofundus ferrinatatus]ATX81925.1 hypothetical protein Ga0123462_1058 [Mariprofundus ferrinatatus]
MNRQVNELIEKIRKLEDELENELAARRDELRFQIVGQRIRFEQEILERHRELKTNLLRYIAEARPLVALTAPFVYALLFPFVLLDLFVTLYQLVCFPVYGIPKVRRRDHMIYDRHQLAYLNILEKFNCFYCAYANGLISYVREIGARTEQYWCPIKHARRVAGSHRRYSRFLDYGDGEGYHDTLEELRCDFDNRKANGRKKNRD